ncbi:hypothetical protein [Endozoicomonas atrinae]|uniref:hypothetical protein n=1 Tax=Endozoicomonas atrinae TaxID=1333660 RepID=UPI000824CF3E|nr:hypothetical protein [Endozoicomonas atrinae]
MTGIASTFSDSWHRIKNVRACLKSTTKVHKQRFRGNWWYVLEDPFNNRFFRLKPETYRFVVSLSHNETIDEA